MNSHNTSAAAVALWETSYGTFGVVVDDQGAVICPFEGPIVVGARRFKSTEEAAVLRLLLVLGWMMLVDNGWEGVECWCLSYSMVAMRIEVVAFGGLECIFCRFDLG